MMAGGAFIWLKLLYAAAMLAAALLSASAAYRMWRRRHVPGGNAFAFLMACLAWWALTAAAEAISSHEMAQVFWSKMQYLGLVWLGPLLLIFTLQYTRVFKEPPNWLQDWLFILPFITLMLAWSNEAHHLIWTQTIFDPRTLTTRYEHGSGFLVFTAYTYILSMAANLILLWSSLHSNRLYRWQVLMVILAVSMPVLGNLLYLFSHATIEGLDPTPLFFNLSGLLLLISLYRFRLLDLSPVNSFQVFDAMRDPVLIADEQKRILDLNQAALELFQVSLAQVLGLRLDEFQSRLPSFSKLFAGFESTRAIKGQVMTEGETWYEVNATQLVQSGESSPRFVVSLHDITAIKAAEQKLARQAADLQAVAEISLLMATAPAKPRVPQQIADQILLRFDLYAVQILLLQDDCCTLRLAAEAGPAHRLVEDVLFELHIDQTRSLIAYVARTREAVLANEARKDPRFLPAAVLPDTEAEMAAPMLYGDQLLGVLDVQSDRVGQFTAQDLDVLMALASQSAVAIQNARLFGQLVERQDQLEQVMGIAHMGDYRVDLTTLQYTMSPELKKLLGGATGGAGDGDVIEALGTDGFVLEKLLEALFPDAGHPARGDLVQTLEQLPMDRVECELHLTSGGQAHTMINRARLIRNNRGQLVALAGAIQDVTEEVQLQQSLRQRQHYLGLLYEITHSASLASDLNELMHVLANQLGRLIGADDCYITRWHAERQITTPGAASGDMQHIYENGPKPIPGEATVTSSVLKLGRTLIIEDVFHSEYLSPRIAAQFPAASLMGLPLMVGTQKFGAALIAFNQPHAFTRDEIEICEQAAGLMSLAFARLAALEDAERRAKEAEILRQAGAAVASTLNLEETIQRILEQLHNVIPYDSASVSLLQGESLVIVGGVGFTDLQTVKGISFNLDERSPSTAVIHTCKPVILADAPQEYEAFHHAPHNHIHGWLGVPLVAQDKVIGMIAIDSTQPEAFNEAHARLATAIANQVSIALVNARLFEDTQTLAITDALTSIFNRRHFFSLAQREYERARRSQKPISIIMLDIDHFKRINDTYGHLSGDRVLQGVAEICRASIRSVDILARYGGEEFVMMLPETDVQLAYNVAERIRLAVALTPLVSTHGDLHITVSLGVYTCVPGNSEESEIELTRMVEHADQALYQSKQAGRNRTTSTK